MNTAKTWLKEAEKNLKRMFLDHNFIKLLSYASFIVSREEAKNALESARKFVNRGPFE